MLFSFRPQAAIAAIGISLLFIIFASATRSGSPATQQSAARDGAGNTYVEAMVGPPRLVNPLLAASPTDRDLAHLVFSGLTRVDETGTLAPDLASAWKASPDSTVYTFTLKSDLRWHDGEPFTADDVLFTLTALSGRDFPGDEALAMAWRRVKVEAPNPQVVRFTLREPDSSFIARTTLGILPRHLWTNVKVADMAGSSLNTQPVGAGPWRYVRAASVTDAIETAGVPTTPMPIVAPADEGVLLEPNPYAPAAKRGFSRIWFRPYPTFGAALTGFRMGEAHGLGHIPEERLAEIADIEGVAMHRQTLARYAMLILNLRSPLFDKPETRRALEHAINRSELVEQSLGGNARPASSPLLRQSWAYDPLVNTRDYNPGEARRLLDDAGWVVGPGGLRAREGVTMTVVLAANEDVPANVAVATRIERYLRDVGVDAKLALVSRERLLRDYLGPRAFHIALANWEAPAADPDVFDYWHSSRANVSGGLNFSGWANEVVDKALGAARATSDRATRARQYSLFAGAFHADVPGIILYSPLYTYATRQASGITLPATDLLDPAQRFDTLDEWSLLAGRAP